MKIKKIPNHIAFILDGNGRWAKKLHQNRNYGHLQGVKTLKEIIKLVQSLNIPYMSVYAFSVENMNRPKEEVDYLMHLASIEFKEILKKASEQTFNIRIIGEDTNLSKEILDLKNKINNLPQQNGFTLFVAFNYSAKWELLHASSGAKDLASLEQNLYTYPADSIDLLIRTGGEQRLSNFMLYQVSYAELFFDRCFWPSYNKRHLMKALKWYQKQKRNFGKI